MNEKLLNANGLTLGDMGQRPSVEEQMADLSEYMDVLAEMVLGGADNGN